MLRKLKKNILRKARKMFSNIQSKETSIKNSRTVSFPDQKSIWFSF